ncbi:unnamed protein product [Closterium sp. NIES-64]|nr:unnamed protein product [Closterium sp. NIES-64]
MESSAISNERLSHPLYEESTCRPPCAHPSLARIPPLRSPLILLALVPFPPRSFSLRMRSPLIPPPFIPRPSLPLIPLALIPHSPCSHQPHLCSRLLSHNAHPLFPLCSSLIPSALPHSTALNLSPCSSLPPPLTLPHALVPPPSPHPSPCPHPSPLPPPLTLSHALIPSPCAHPSFALY